MNRLKQFCDLLHFRGDIHFLSSKFAWTHNFSLGVNTLVNNFKIIDVGRKQTQVLYFAIVIASWRPWLCVHSDRVVGTPYRYSQRLSRNFRARFRGVLIGAASLTLRQHTVSVQSMTMTTLTLCQRSQRLRRHANFKETFLKWNNFVKSLAESSSGHV